MLHSAFNRSSLGNNCTIMMPFSQAGTLRHRGEMTRPRSQGWGRTGLGAAALAHRAVCRNLPGVAGLNCTASQGKGIRFLRIITERLDFISLGRLQEIRNSYGREINTWEETKMCFQQLFIVLSNCKGVKCSNVCSP